MRLRIDNRPLELLLSVILLGTISLLLAACGSQDEASSGGSGDADSIQLRVVTSLPLFADLAQQVGGDRIDTVALLPTGADPHTFQPSPQDIQKITEADLVIVNGLGLEMPMLHLTKPNMRGGATLLQLAERTIADGASAIGENPHLWLDVTNAKEYTRIIRDTLVTADPDRTAEYEANYQRFLEELEGLDQYVQGQISSVPPARRYLVTTHDAFPYLARYLGFEVLAVVAASSNQEPSPRDIVNLLQAIGDKSVPAVFTEPQLGAQGQLLEQAAAVVGVTVCTLYADSLDDDVESYMEMMRFNADEIAHCLGQFNG